MGPECRPQGAHVGPGRADTLGVGLGPVADEGAHVGPFGAGRLAQGAPTRWARGWARLSTGART